MAAKPIYRLRKPAVVSGYTAARAWFLMIPKMLVVALGLVDALARRTGWFNKVLCMAGVRELGPAPPCQSGELCKAASSGPDGAT